MPSNERQTIEQAKFIKAFEKQKKTIEDLEEKQIKAIEGNKKQLDNKKQFDNNELLLSNEREIFKNICNKRLDKMMDYLKKLLW